MFFNPRKSDAAGTVDGEAANELSELVWCGRLGTPFVRLAGFITTASTLASVCCSRRATRHDHVTHHAHFTSRGADEQEESARQDRKLGASPG